jgi:hypothetical protein
MTTIKKKFIKCVSLRFNNIYYLYIKFRIFFWSNFFKKKIFFKNFKIDLPLYLVNKCCAISESHEYIYFRIPKAANSNIILTLHAATKTNFIYMKSLGTDNLKKSYTRPAEVSANKLKEINNYFKFSVVRNPYTRVLSAYLDKIVRNRQQKVNVTSFLKCRFSDFISLEKFIYYLECGGVKDDVHWALQSEIIFIPIKYIDFIGRVENLEEDMAFITKKIFGKEFPLQNFQNHHRTNSKSKIDRLLTDHLREKIYKIYENDFKLFKYSK